MTTFRFDDCIYSKRLRRECQEQGLAEASRLPRELLGRKDHEILPALAAANAAIVTEDRRIAAENADFLSGGHPGVVIVANAPSVMPTITDSLVREILARLKDQYPPWHCSDIRNSIIEITQEGVWVWHAEAGTLVHDEYIPYSAADLAAVLERVLRANAQRGGGSLLAEGH